MATKESSNQLYDQRNIVEYVKQFFVPSFLCYLNVESVFTLDTNSHICYLSFRK